VKPDFTFVIPVAPSSVPKLVEGDADLALWVDDAAYTPINKSVALKNGRRLTGTIHIARPLTSADDAAILQILNDRFTRR
jgi:hypothetical protein